MAGRAAALWVVVTAGLLAGCATPLEMVDVRSIEAQPAMTGGTPFARALYTAYRDQTREADRDRKWTDAAFYAGRGLAVARGETVLPETVAHHRPANAVRCEYLCIASEPKISWRIPSARGPVLEAARSRLMADLAKGARRTAPVLAARTQVAFDCWAEEEFHLHTRSACRTRFLDLAPKLRRGG
jgi:hypothetical protein